MPDWSIKNIPQRDSSIKYTTKNQDPNRYVKINNIDYIELTVREAIVHSSLGLSQGYVRCNCGGKCALLRFYLENYKLFFILKLSNNNINKLIIQI